MGKCLILITNYYPYHKGEEYLESEIKYLSNSFEKVIIIPTMVNKSMELTRKTPFNVDVLNINYHHSIKNKIINTFKKSNTKNYNLNPIKRLYQNYFNNRSDFVFELLKRELSNHKIEDYSGIVIYSYWLYITAQVGILLKEYLTEITKAPIKLLSRAHRYDLYENESKLGFLPSREYILDNLDFVFPCSDDGTKYLSNKYMKYSHKIVTERLGSTYQGKNHVSNEHVFQIVSCSAMRKVKRIDLLIEALNELEQRNIKYFWTHFGDGEEYEKLLLYSKKKLNSKNYKFFGFVSNNELMNYYKEQHVNCFINVSKSEGIPVSIMEAMSFSIPVIATDVGGTREIVVDKYNGFLLDKNITYIELADKLEEFIKLSCVEYAQYREKAFLMWQQEYDSSILYSKFSSKLQQMLGDER